VTRRRRSATTGGPFCVSEDGARVRFVPLAGKALGFGELVCGQPRVDSVDTLRLIPLPTGSNNNKTCQRSGLLLFLSDGTDNLLLILKLQMN